MLFLKIGNTHVDYRSLEIPVLLRSPLFSDGKGSFIFNFSLPVTPSLAEEFQFIHRPSRSGPASIQKDLYLQYNDLKYTSIATVSQADPKTYEISCPIENGDFASLLKKKKLTDIDLGGVRECNTGSISVIATDSAHISVYHLNTYNSVYVDLSFDQVTLNEGLILISSGSQISAPETGSMIIKIVFELDKRYGYLYFETLVNGQINTTMVLDTTFFNFMTEIFVNEGDLVSYRIKANPQNHDGANYIDFSIPDQPQLEVYLQGAMNNNAGTYNYPANDFALFPVMNPKILDNLDDNAYMVDDVSVKEIYTNFFPIQNYYKNNRFPLFLFGESEDEKFLAFNMFCPFPFLAYVINQMAVTLGITISNNVFDAEPLNQLVIYHPFTENDFIKTDLIKPVEGFDLIDHVPDLLISDYFTNICNLLGITWTYSSHSKTLTFKTHEAIATDTDWVPFPGIVHALPTLTANPYNGFLLKQVTQNDSFAGDNFKSIEKLTYKGELNSYWLLPWQNNQLNDCYFLIVPKSYYYWNYDPETFSITWLFFSGQFQLEYKQTDETIDAAPLTISSNIAAVMTNIVNLEDKSLLGEGRGWIIPETHQAGGFDGLKGVLEIAPSNSLLFYRGMQLDSNFNLYPFASWDVYNYAREVVNTEGHHAELALSWEGEFGLYEKRYKKWIDIMMKSPGIWEFTVTLTPSQIAGIDFLKWYTIQGHRFLITEMSFTIHADHISPVLLKVFSR